MRFHPEPDLSLLLCHLITVMGNLPIQNNSKKWITILMMNAALSVFIVMFFMHGVFDSFKNFLIAFLWGFSISFTQWAGLSEINLLLDRKFSWLDKPC